jgi:hypothetical protein
MEGLEFARPELRAHRPELLDADPVFAGDRAAHGDAQFEDLGAEVLGTLDGARLAGIKQDQWVQVAVPGVEYVGHREAGRL